MEQARSAASLAADLFRGWPRHTLILDPSKLATRATDGKRAGEHAYRTVERDRTAQDFEYHLAGKAALGASPLLEDGTCVFGAIDIDLYNATSETVDAISKALRTATGALFRSKSRALQFYVFAEEPIPAELMVRYLKSVRARLPKAARAASQEIFPKQTDPAAVREAPSAINFPLFGSERECIAIFSKDGRTGTPHDSLEPQRALQAILELCRLSRADIELVAERQETYVDRSAAGYREPTDAAGRQDHLFRAGCSMQSRGWDDDAIQPELERLNRAHAETGHPAWGNKGPLEDRRLRDMMPRILAWPKGAPTDVHYGVVEQFNESYAVLDINGKIEFLDLKADDFVTYSWGDLLKKTAPRRVRVGKNIVPVAPLWINDPDRKELVGIVTEPLSYSGRSYNRWQGFAVEPLEGDSGLFFEHYLTSIICGGDEALAKWIVHWLADPVQRPTEPSVPSALAMRGPQGQGKGFLLDMEMRIFGSRGCEIVHESERLFSKFNRGIFGKTIVGCEESIFTGDRAIANKLKAFIASPTWTYEEKFKQSFAAKNVHRIIANTNSEQAVHLDRDDRRWTVAEVRQRWDVTTPDGQAKAYRDWEPFYRFLRGDGPRLVLHRLLETKVDRSLITFGHGTAAKARDKIQSNPVLAVLDEIAETGVVPHDRAGLGVISIKTLTKLVRERAGAAGRFETSESVSAEFDKLVPRRPIVRNAVFIEEVRMGTDEHGCPSINYRFDGRQRGRVLGTLADFRETVSCLTMVEYGAADGEEWAMWEHHANWLPAGSEDLPF